MREKQERCANEKIYGRENWEVDRFKKSTYVFLITYQKKASFLPSVCTRTPAVAREEAREVRSRRRRSLCLSDCGDGLSAPNSKLQSSAK